MFMFGEAFAVNPLLGAWSSRCAPDGSGNFNIETFQFKKNEATYSIKTYYDSNCNNKISTLSTQREYKLGERLPGTADIRKLDYIFKSVYMTYNDQAAVNKANQSRNYGFSNWAVNQPQNVSHLKLSPSASPEHANGEKFYTIVKITTDKLFMGDYDSGKGDSDHTRLSKVYPVPFIKESI
jgi:hypothetical protein